MSNLTVQRIREVLRYDPATGLFERIERMGRYMAGPIVGRQGSHGYFLIGIDGTQYLAHRIAFVLMTGHWPVGHVDHMDGNRSNNRWENLRDVSVVVNQQNRRAAQSNSKTGLLGVSWYPLRSKFCARLKVGKTYKNLGYFATAEEAYQVYLKNKRSLHEGCTI